MTVAWAKPGVAESPVGTPGKVVGVTALEATDAALAPRPLFATTVNV